MRSVLVSLILTLLAATAWCSELTRIAVMEIDVTSPQSAAYAKKLAADIRTALGNLPGVEVMSLKELKDWSKRLGFNLVYADADTAAADLGRRLNVDFVVMGNAVRLGKVHKVTIRMLQVATAQAATTKGDVDETKKAQAAFVERVVEDFRGFTRAQADRHYQIALQYLQAGDFGNALKAFKNASAVDPRYTAPLVGQVVCYYSMDSLAMAEVMVDSALALDPSLGQANYYKASILQKRDRCEEALPYFQKAMEAEPTYTPVYFNWALCLRSLGRPGEASALLQRALNYTTEVTYRASLGRLYEDLGMTADAFRVYAGVVQDDSTYSYAWRRIIAAGSDYLVTGDFSRGGQDSMGFTREKVVELVKKGIAKVIQEDGPKAAPVYKYLGRALTDIGRDAEALQVYQEWERIDPGNTEPIQLQVGILARAGKPEQAIRRLEDVVRRNPDNVNAIAFLALAQADLGRMEAAKARSAEALRKGPDEPIAHMVAGEIKERESERLEEAAKRHVLDKSIPYEQRYDEAEQMFDQAIRLVREAKEYYDRARQLFRARQDTERAAYVEKKSKVMDSEVQRLEAVKTATIYAGE